ncbi:hypothetical protein ACIOD2_46620 [Amycolatopsis sp. NPDC088138]|uniref:hypothetical protein n=1 Tax=Amycolatopsis sp. NPDC088138 TaxID=3363938 RepID=UPI003824DD2E
MAATEDKPDLTDATTYAAKGSKLGDRWHVLSDGETVHYQRADGTFAPRLDKNDRVLTIVTAADLRRGVDSWEQVPREE